VYLFLPYGIQASRAFQPDPLMTCAALWATLALARHVERATPARMIAAATAVAVAALVKPMSVFMTVPAGVAFAFVQNANSPARSTRVAFRRWLTHLAPVWLGLLPAAAYYGFGAIVGTLARDQMRLRFVPSLLDSPFFWNGLATQIRRVFSLPVFACAVVGTIVAGAARPLLVAWWIGYAAFAVAFTYHVPTHDYYHLPFIALAGVALSAMVERINPRAPIAYAVAVAIAIWGAFSAWPRLQPGALAARVRHYEEIGELAEHTTHAVFLDADYGYPLMYHGEVSGDAWPGRDDLAAEALAGADAPEAGTRLARDYDYGPTHFIVTDLASLAAQPDLQALLAARATVVRQTPSYHVYKFTR
jgi:Dolichyl-phosphate-mannose-protein mannosyltransferase